MLHLGETLETKRVTLVVYYTGEKPQSEVFKLLLVFLLLVEVVVMDIDVAV